MLPGLLPEKYVGVKDKMGREHDFPADLCLKCSTCNTVCPVYAVNPDYPGPKFIGPEIARLRELKQGECGAADYCTGCRQCEFACPNSVQITHLVHRSKAEGRKGKGIPFRDQILGHNQLVSGLASLVPHITNTVLGCNFFRSLMEKILGIKNRPFPTYQRAFSYQASHSGTGALKVAYFTGCYSRFNGTSIAQSVVNVLGKCGVEVVVPPQKCCGVSMISNGLIEEGKGNARFNLDILGNLVDQGYQIVTSCPSCALSLKHEYGSFFNLPQAAKVADQVFDISEYLLHYQLLQDGKFLPIKKRYFYHQPCHTKAQGIGSPVLELLKPIPELTLVTREQKCCGQAGTYGFKKEKYDTSAAIAKKLFYDIAESRVDGIVTECGMCSLQLSGGTGKEIFHPLELLDTTMRTIDAKCKD